MLNKIIDLWKYDKPLITLTYGWGTMRHYVAKSLGIVVLVLLSSSVLAGDLVLNFKSFHYKKADHFNERNEGLGYQTEDYETGFFKNTYRSTSYYVGKVSREGNFSVSWA